MSRNAKILVIFVVVLIAPATVSAFSFYDAFNNFIAYTNRVTGAVAGDDSDLEGRRPGLPDEQPAVPSLDFAPDGVYYGQDRVATVSDAAPNSRVTLFLTRPDGVQACGTFGCNIGTTDDSGQLQYSETIQAGTMTGTWCGWVVVSRMTSNTDCYQVKQPVTATPTGSLFLNQTQCVVPIGGTSCAIAVNWTTSNTQYVSVMLEDLSTGTQNELSTSISGTADATLEPYPHSYAIVVYNTEGKQFVLASAKASAVEQRILDMKTSVLAIKSSLQAGLSSARKLQANYSDLGDSRRAAQFLDVANKLSDTVVSADIVLSNIDANNLGTVDSDLSALELNAKSALLRITGQP